MSRAPLRWVATCARGLEEIVHGELVALGLPPLGGQIGGVGFEGPLSAGLKACWRLRAANRVVLELASWPAPSDLELERGAFSLAAGTARTDPMAFADLLHPSLTFAITATSSRSKIRDTRWIALKVKDGLVDGQRRRYGERSSIDRERPDFALRVRLHDDRATLLLDLCGEPLDHRGYRVETTAAPLREQLAAAALLASGWDGRGPVVDPMCGSGTFLAEAGAIALGLAPNRLRTGWAFERLPGYDSALFDRIRAEPIPAPDPELELFGVDSDLAAVSAARSNLVAAGLADRARLEAGDAFDFAPPPTPGLVAVNPPYGDRLGSDAAAWRRLGDLLKQRYRGWRAVVVAGDAALGRELGLRPKRRIPFWNGPIEARFLILELW